MTRFTEQVRPVVEPSSIRGLPNGDYPASSLVDITDHAGKVVGRLCREAARAWQAMVAHAWRDGIDLRPTSSADTFRPIAVQRRIFAERYRETDQSNGSRVCSGKRWWKRKGVATAACPGTSNHGKAIAIDVANCSGARLAWLEANAWTYGFAWELVPEEPWHIRYCTGDAIPAAVLAYEKSGPAAEDDMYDDKAREEVVGRLDQALWLLQNSVAGTLTFIVQEIAKGADVDEVALAQALAPLVTANLERLSDADLKRIAVATADEEARRLGAK